jgi:glycosyltransferase involved in cell wall biosynthesis
MVQIQILMGVYEGTAYLKAQLQSLVDQDHSDWKLYVSDDSPNAISRQMIGDFFTSQSETSHGTGSKESSCVQVTQGARMGFAANYMHMIETSSDGFLALADQDDIWCPDKLSRALAGLADVPADVPALYCARSMYWDGQDKKRLSVPFRRAPSFRNALVENIAQGNTIVLNPAAARLARAAAPQVKEVFAHDWWLYLLISGAGGTIVSDNGPAVLLYRQHPENLIGSGQGIKAQIMRKSLVLRGQLTERLDLNDAALNACSSYLTPENGEYHAQFTLARKSTLPRRLLGLYALGIYRQHPFGTFGFLGASLLGRA